MAAPDKAFDEFRAICEAYEGIEAAESALWGVHDDHGDAPLFLEAAAAVSAARAAVLKFGESIGVKSEGL